MGVVESVKNFSGRGRLLFKSKQRPKDQAQECLWTMGGVFVKYSVQAVAWLFSKKIWVVFWNKQV